MVQVDDLDVFWLPKPVSYLYGLNKQVITKANSSKEPPNPELLEPPLPVVNNVTFNGQSARVVTQLDKEQSQALKLLNITMPKGTVAGTLGKYLPKNIQKSII